MERIVGGVTRVVVGRGILPTVLDDAAGTAVVLCQPGSELTASLLGDVPTLVMPDGEAAKTLDTVGRTVEWLAELGVRRDGTIVAVGGGAVLDVAGFVGAVYLRGIGSRYAPTTLLAAVDAAIGGKTAVNVAGKNLVGTFTHPERVVVDLDVIGAIPEPLLVEGMAEIVKAGAIADPVLFEAIERDGTGVDLETLVGRAISVKADVVDGDFTEQGRRAILNFGHTIGHAVEFLSGWAHGHSVAVGMVAAAAASAHAIGFTGTDRIVGALDRVGLPTSAPELDLEAVTALVEVDKKADVDGIRMVLLEDFGAPVVSHVDSATLGAALAAIGIGGS